MVFDGQKWTTQKYKITRTVVLYDDRPELYPDGTAVEVVLTVEQAARLAEIQGLEMAMGDAERYVMDGTGKLPEPKSDIEKLVDLIPKEKMTQEVIDLIKHARGR